MWGQNNQSTGFGGGGGGFGQNTGSTFGQPAQQQQNSTFTFGANNNQQQQQQQQQPQQQSGFGGGTSTFTFGANNNQAQQQPQQTGIFGAPAQQQQQPQQNSIFGGGAAQPQQNNAFGGGARPGFGATGSSFSFGGGQPAAGTSTFGGNAGSTFGNTTSTFGKPATTFGAAPAAGATAGGMFGGGGATNNVATTNIGNSFPRSTEEDANFHNLGKPTYEEWVDKMPRFGLPGEQNPLDKGTRMLDYQPSWVRDGEFKTVPQKEPHLFHNIGVMAPYRHLSFEEMRFMDKAQNQPPPTQPYTPQTMAGIKPPPHSFTIVPPNVRNDPLAMQLTEGWQQQLGRGYKPMPAPGAPGMGAQGGGMFGGGSTGAFGAPAPAAGGFGQASTSTFGQPANNAGASTFGQPQPQQTGLFGGGGNTSTGLFGQQPQQPAQNQGTGLFGGGGGFGATGQQPQQGASTFGSFGAAKPATTTFGTGSTGGFGQTGTTGTSTFGQPAPAAQSTFSFGQTPQQNQPAQGQPAGGFGSTFGGFGANQQQNQQQPQQQQQSTFSFGQNGQQQPAQPSTGLFGSAPKPATSFGGFGAAPAATTNTGTGFGGFGQAQQPAQQNQPPAGAGGFSFGQPNPSSAAPGAGTSLFGGTQPPAQQQNAGTSLFGTNNAAPAAGTGSSLFGSFGAKPAAPTGSLFGAQPQQQQQQQQQPGTSLFGGNNPSTGSTGLFGSTAAPKPATTFGGFGTGSGSTGLFGSTQQPAQAPAFGSQPAAQGSFGFGSTAQPAQNNTFGGFGTGSTFGQAQQQTQQQPSLTASVDVGAYGNNPLFQYADQKPEFSLQNKKPALPPLASSTFRSTPRKGQVDKLRGFSSPSLSASRGSPGSPISGLSVPNRTSSPVPADRYKGLTDASISPSAFVPRPSIKRLSVTPRSLPTSGSQDHLELVLGKSALRSPAPGSPAAQTPRASFQPSPAARLLNSSNGGNGYGNGNGNGYPGSPSPASGRPVASPSVSAQEAPLKHGDYWCKPRLDKLRQLGKPDLREMRNFTAGRVGYGEVEFLEPVDLTGLDLDAFLGSVVVFTEMELAVYPDDGPGKPARGAGLNVPARITLEGVFTRDKATKKNITDSSDPRYAKFMKRIKSIPDTEFVSYTPEGVWVFEVQHFSRYGLRESDSEEEQEETGAMRAKRTLVEREREGLGGDKKKRAVRDEGEDDHSEDESHGASEHSEGSASLTESEEGDGSGSESEGSAVFASAPAPAKANKGAHEWEKVKEMQKSRFVPHVATVDVGALKRKAASGGYAPRPQVQGLTPSLKRTAGERRQDFESAEEGRNAVDARVVKRASFGETAIPPQLRQPRKFARVALGESVVGGEEGVRVDAGLALGRSFRCSWGPNGELVHFGKIGGAKAAAATGTDAEVFVQQIDMLAGEDKAEAAKADRLLRLHLDRSIVRFVDGAPVAAIDADIRFRDFAERYDLGDRSHEANTFRLGMALFDEIDLRLPLDSPDDLRLRIAEVRRKLALSRWLEDAVAPLVDAELIRTNSRPAKVFTLLSGNQVERAVQSAIEGNDLRLATLLAQVGGPDEFRDEVRKQLDDWARYKATPLISPEYRRVYALLAGITDVSAGDKARGIDGCADVPISAGLDWKRALGVRMWFAGHFEDDISTVLADYECALDEAHAPAKPSPAYLESGEGGGRRWVAPDAPSDILFGLIRLYADSAVPLDEVLRARDASASPLDARVLWHLYLLLSRVLRKRDFTDRVVATGEMEGEGEEHSKSADALTQGYAAQLESVGEWLGAAFVLLHLETRDGREQAIKALLLRHPDPTEGEVRHLTTRLCVPAAWVHEANAAQRAQSGDVYGEYEQLVLAGAHDRAHAICVQKLMPEVVLRDDLELMRRLGERVGLAKEYEYGAKLFVDYVDVRSELSNALEVVLRGQGSEHAEQERASVRVRELSKTLSRLLLLLPACFPDKDDTQQVAALADMLSHLHSLAGGLCAAGYITRPAVPPLLVDVDRLHLLQDAAMDAFTRNLESVGAA